MNTSWADIDSSERPPANVTSGQLAPIVLFVYNRPDHTRRTIESLLRNPQASQSELVIYSDGPRGEKDRDRVRQVRDYLGKISGFRKILVNHSQINRGLAASIIDGVTSVVSQYGRVIVLEDDLSVSPFFLDYMNSALSVYADDERVMHVSGYWYPVTFFGMPETFFLPVPSSWGWATWARAWKWFKKDALELRQTFTREDILRFNLGGANNFWEQVIHNLNGKANTWAVFWYAAMFRQQGLSLYPAQSMVNNTGTDGTGIHCLITDIYDSDLAQSRVDQFTRKVEEDRSVLEHLKKFYRKNRIGRVRRFLEIGKKHLRHFFQSMQ